MGGHDLGPKAKVPSPDIYKVEDVPELMDCQKRLAEKGLKDPWLRNEVWQYLECRGTLWQRSRGFFRGVPTGAVFFLITLAVENYFGISYEPKHDEHEAH